MIVKARRLLFVMAEIARFKRLQCLGVRVGKVASCEGGSSKSTSVEAFFQQIFQLNAKFSWIAQESKIGFLVFA